MKPELFDGKPKYEGVVTEVDKDSIYNSLRGRTTKKLYTITRFSVDPEGEVIPPKLVISNGETVQLKFDSDLIKKYSISYQKEDNEANFYLLLYPRSKEESPLILKYNSELTLEAMIEMPERDNYSALPLHIDCQGNIYWLEKREEYVRLSKWSEKK